jgi:hypothetical protein
MPNAEFSTPIQPSSVKSKIITKGGIRRQRSTPEETANTKDSLTVQKAKKWVDKKFAN